MSKPNILVCDGMDKDVFKALSEDSFFEVCKKAKHSAEEISELKKNATALVIRSATTVSEDFLKNCPNLKYVIRAGEGTDNIDKNKCSELGIKVSNTPGANNNSAAEHAVALTMTLLRHTANANSSMQEGNWEKPLFTGNELTNKKVGIIGFGRIGQLYAKRITGFDPEITYYDPFIEKHSLDYQNIKKEESLEKIFSESDVISIHVPKNKHTENLINKSLLSLMKDGSILVNAARGGIIVEDDLIEVLNSKKIKAALDVFNKEPLKQKTNVHGLSNLLLTPHLGGSTHEAQSRVGQMAYDQLSSFFKDNKLLNEVKS